MNTLFDPIKTLTYYILEEKTPTGGQEVNTRQMGIAIGFQALVVLISGWCSKSGALVV